MRLFFRMRYTHITLSLNKELTDMYSFGRRRLHNPFIGGFVHESRYEGVLQLRKNIDCKVIRLAVTDEQFEIIKNEIKKFDDEYDHHKYSMIGVFMCFFNHNFIRKQKFYCTQFMLHLLQEAGIIDHINIGMLRIPEHFCKLENAEVIYSGILDDYIAEEGENICQKS